MLMRLASLNKEAFMDKLERKLKQDAADIDATVTPELQARLDATLHALESKSPPARKSQTGLDWWWLSSLTGIAAALLLIVYLNRGGVVEESVAPPVAVESMPDIMIAPLAEIPLDIRSAEFADPLAQELENLQSDFEKAREKLGFDPDKTL